MRTMQLEVWKSMRDLMMMIEMNLVIKTADQMTITI